MRTFIKLFKDGIFLLQTARFGKVAEIMVKKKYGLFEPPQKTTKYDLWDNRNNTRIEVKFSTVRENDKETITEDTIVEKCITAKWQNTPIKYKECKRKIFNRNIEQVKTSEFDVLYYGLFFWDKILIFKINANAVSSISGWSGKMHRGKAGNYVEGQFHITNENIQYHVDNYIVDILTYDTLFRLVNPYQSTRILVRAIFKNLLKNGKVNQRT